MLARRILTAVVALCAAATLPACLDAAPDVPLGGTTQEVDTTPPTITLSGPATVFAPGTVNLSATASDASGIAKVRLFRGLTLWKEDFTAPYTAAIPVSLQDLGTQYYVALAYDNAGNTTMSNVIMTTVVAGAPPIIGSFTATPSSLPHGGGTVTLAWEVPGATQVTVSPPLDAQHQATIAESTVFTLTATNLFGTSHATRAVMVAPALPPTIDSFAATPSSLPIGGGTATLSWNVTGADQVTIDQGVGDVTGTSAHSVAPTATTTYTLSATSAGGTVTAKATIDVATPPPPRFLVGPGGVDAGDCQATPCRTIAYAAGRSLGVGHVVLLDGTYDTSTQGSQAISLPAGTHLVADHPSQATVKALLVFPAGGHVEGVRIDRRAPNQSSSAGVKATGGALALVGVDFAGRFDTEAILASGAATVAMTPGGLTDYTALTEAVPANALQRAFVRVLDSAQVVVVGGTFGGPGLGCNCSTVNNGSGAAMAVTDTGTLILDHVILRFHTRGVATLGAGRFELRSSTLAPHAASASGGYGVLLQAQLATNAPTARLQTSTINGLGVLAQGVRTISTGTSAHLELSIATIMNATTGVAAWSGTSLSVAGQFAQLNANATAGIRCAGACDVDLAEGALTGNGTSSSGSGALWLGATNVAYHLRLRGVIVASNGGPGALNAADNSAIVLRGNADSTFDLGSAGDPGGNELLNNVSGAATTSLYVDTAGVTVTARDNTFEANQQGADALGAYPNHGAVTGCGRNYCVVAGGLTM